MKTELEARLDPNECGVILSFLQNADFNIKGQYIPIVSSAMHKMQAVLVEAGKLQGDASSPQKEPVVRASGINKAEDGKDGAPFG